MTTPETVKKPSSGNLIMSAEEWLKADFSVAESEVLLGTTGNALVRPLTKNLIQAPEKAFKTTFLLRLALGISTGETVYPSLPVNRALRVLYLHGELSPSELKERLKEAAVGLKRPLDNFLQGRSLNASLVTKELTGIGFLVSVLQDRAWESSHFGSSQPHIWGFMFSAIMIITGLFIAHPGVIYYGRRIYAHRETFRHRVKKARSHDIS